MNNSVTWKIGGEAGFGIMSSGIMLSKIYSRLGYSIFATNEYPSLIRGGHNVVTVRIATHTIHAMTKDLHVLIALNKKTVELHRDECGKNTVIVYDPKDYEWKQSELPPGVSALAVPLTEIIQKFDGDPVMRNTAALGASLALLGSDFSSLQTMLADQFGKKGEEVVKHNVSIAKAGFDYVKEKYPEVTSAFLNPQKKGEKTLVVNGSEAMGLGAVKAGLKFAAIYPMTPINAIISSLADHDKQLGLMYVQPEDEISGINMAIGASVAGVRSMVATSGGGFALMVEGLSLAGMMEVPLVIDMGMRVGPATGMPTWTEAGELRFIIHAGHGEFPRIVFAPSDAEETYDLTVRAFDLADRFQTQVFVLTDKYLNESQWTLPASVVTKDVVIDRGSFVTKEQLQDVKDFKRYALDVKDGISPRSFPGTPNGQYIANSYEHDEVGVATEDPKMRVDMVNKRAAKWRAIEKIVPPPTIYGEEKADITFVGWGTTKGAILEAIELLKAKGVSAKLIHYTWMFPFAGEATKKLLAHEKRVILVEQNGTAQLGSLISEFAGMKIEEKILKYDGRPLYPEEIVEKVGKI
jgi:2-oxoglutarate/2-oxoacid ferredoxin oxidoreductase subunit alpha